jgi:hypothetical protein
MVTEDSSPGIKRSDREYDNCPSVVEFKNAVPLIPSWLLNYSVHTEKASRDFHGIHSLLQCESSYDIAILLLLDVQRDMPSGHIQKRHSGPKVPDSSRCYRLKVLAAPRRSHQIVHRHHRSVGFPPVVWVTYLRVCSFFRIWTRRLYKISTRRPLTAYAVKQLALLCKNWQSSTNWLAFLFFRTALQVHSTSGIAQHFQEVCFLQNLNFEITLFSFPNGQ